MQNKHFLWKLRQAGKKGTIFVAKLFRREGDININKGALMFLNILVLIFIVQLVKIQLFNCCFLYINLNIKRALLLLFQQV